jgi:Rab-GTPase-TBC domain
VRLLSARQAPHSCAPGLMAAHVLSRYTNWLIPYRFATGKGVQSLMNVLKAYAALDPEVGYCQGARHRQHLASCRHGVMQSVQQTQVH